MRGYFFRAARTSSRRPAEPSRTFLAAMNFAYSGMKTLPGSRRSNFSG
jgi:hypothetical protein